MKGKMLAIVGAILVAAVAAELAVANSKPGLPKPTLTSAMKATGAKERVKLPKGSKAVKPPARASLSGKRANYYPALVITSDSGYREYVTESQWEDSNGVWWYARRTETNIDCVGGGFTTVQRWYWYAGLSNWRYYDAWQWCGGWRRIG